MTVPGWLASYGLPWPAMASGPDADPCHGPAMACHGLPWPAMACYGLPWPAMALFNFQPFLLRGPRPQFKSGCTESNRELIWLTEWMVNGKATRVIAEFGPN